MDCQEQVIQCPYGANDSPKLQETRAQVKEINSKLNALIMIVILLHGAELIALVNI